MSDVETKLRDLRARQQELSQRRARREADLDNARARAKEAAEAIRAEFGVGSVEEARELLEAKKAELEQLMDELIAKLREAEE